MDKDESPAIASTKISKFGESAVEISSGALEKNVVSAGSNPIFISSQLSETGCATAVWKMASWTPRRCRWDPAAPPEFGIWMNVLFALAGTFTVANLYYNHPILNIIAIEFGITNEESARVPTLMQAGYAIGLVFICPLGDIFKRRAFVLMLIFFTATLWLGLCITKSFSVFLGLSFITSVTTVTPQLMLPLVGDLTPPNRRATALAIVTSGILLGMLFARFLSGILTEYTNWRSIYWFSLAMQYLILILLFFFMPDYPSTNPGGLNYFKMLYSIVQMIFKYPVLVQCCLVGLMLGSIFTNYWTTLTFLLSSSPYSYNSVTIGGFAFIGIGAMLYCPTYSKFVIDRFVPLFSIILGIFYCMIGVIIGTYTGEFTVAGPIIQAFAIDFGAQTAQIANRSAIYALVPTARNRVNTAYMVFVFCGQIMGTAVGNQLYARGGWTASGSASLGCLGAALIVCLVRGPRNQGWIGWSGGWSPNKKDSTHEQGPVVEESLEISAQRATPPMEV